MRGVCDAMGPTEFVVFDVRGVSLLKKHSVCLI